jgi:hypothetical protein
MLRFATPLTPAATRLLEGALESACWDISPSLGPKMMRADFDEEQSLWAYNYPLGARLFCAPLAHATILDMHAKLSAPEEYVPTDYHWLLLYSVLETMITYLNDGASEYALAAMLDVRTEDDSFLEPRHATGGARVSLEDFVEAYFWDTDFLLESPGISHLTGQQKRQLGMSDELFGIAAGMPPHPEELAMDLWTEPS